MKKMWKAFCAVAMMCMMSMTLHAEEKTITMGTLSWEDLTPITGITKTVLEQAGYTVKVVEFSEWGIAYAALSKGDIQLMVSQTDYAAHDYWKKTRTALRNCLLFPLAFIRALPCPDTLTSIRSINLTKTQRSLATRSLVSSLVQA